MLVELASYIGDVQSFYLDHQFGELNAETAVESKNLEKLLREAGVEIVGAAPAVVPVTFYVRIPVSTGGSDVTYDKTALPIIKSGTTVNSDSGVTFELIEDVDFSATKADGAPATGITYVVGEVDANNNPINWIFLKDNIPNICSNNITILIIFE